MQSKLPVRIKRKQVPEEKGKCCCAQLLQFMLDISSHEFSDEKGSCKSKRFSANKQCFARSTQTDNYDSNKYPYLEIKSILISINGSLEQILYALQDKKELLYNKLYEKSCMQGKNIKNSYSKIRTEKIKKRAMISKNYNASLEIPRLYYGYPLWFKQYMERSAYHLSPSASNLIICPKLCNRPSSCSDINYFQTMGRILHRTSMGMSISPHPIFTLIGRGDFQPKEDNDIDDFDQEQSRTQEENSP
ncbi:uncharacterized protein LOC109544255 isoform X2 [Dendroctonus ponderosae]|uniref:Uncharacterized protein n=1 Tax=Dendroctonus ponderosae TaxID=77166 RepID=A0AAR5Q9K2_DENPD|nr:uncharacterized protein LOC109544255 isoform X2 [Dendroctonus ponderosae]KAH1011262.1 hypothetical protein HUJ04_000674 [Dendroctonus ponderosae]